MHITSGWGVECAQFITVCVFLLRQSFLNPYDKVFEPQQLMSESSILAKKPMDTPSQLVIGNEVVIH